MDSTREIYEALVHVVSLCFEKSSVFLGERPPFMPTVPFCVISVNIYAKDGNFVVFSKTQKESNNLVLKLKSMIPKSHNGVRVLNPTIPYRKGMGRDGVFLYGQMLCFDIIKE